MGGLSLFDVPLGGNREDVGNALPDYPNGDRPGFPRRSTTATVVTAAPCRRAASFVCETAAASPPTTSARGRKRRRTRPAPLHNASGACSSPMRRCVSACWTMRRRIGGDHRGNGELAARGVRRERFRWSRSADSASRAFPRQQHLGPFGIRRAHQRDVLVALGQQHLGPFGVLRLEPVGVAWSCKQFIHQLQ